MEKNNCIDRFFERVNLTPEAPAFHTKRNGTFKMQSWREYGELVRNFGKGLIRLGHRKGDAVAILSYNRPEWLVSCIGAQSIGGVSAGIYTSCAPDDVKHVLNHSEAPFLVIENESKYRAQVSSIADDLPTLKHIILLEGADQVQDSRVISFAQVIELGMKEKEDESDERRARISPEQIATFIYTSGTTGRAKAVMLSHSAIDFTVATAVSNLNVSSSDVLLSYLPLAHVAEQMFSVYAPIYSGMVLYFAESVDKVPDNLKEALPTVFFGVPRVYEKFFEKITARLATAQGVKKVLFDFFGNVGKRYWLLKHEGKDIPLLLKVQYELGQRLIFQKVKSALGLSRVRLCVSGAAPISPSILEFFLQLDLPIYEVYGQSEDSGPTSFNFPGQTKIGSVGKPFPGVKVKIATDGEILVKGPNLFSGYYKDPSATAETIKDGWLLSGDIGEIDNEGFVKITDRKKDLLITAGGKNVAPQNLESLLKEIPLVSSAVVVGDKKKYLAAILTPNMENLHSFAKQEGISMEDAGSLVKHGKILEAIQKHIDGLNKKLTPVEQIKKFHLLERDFSIEEGELTPTMKVKRKVVNARYEEVINMLYV